MSAPPKNPDHFLFGLDYHEDGKRQRPSFATLKEARKEAVAVDHFQDAHAFTLGLADFVDDLAADVIEGREVGFDVLSAEGRGKRKTEILKAEMGTG